MDGFDNSDNILVIAATNRGDTLDDALLRPGRFDRIITIDLPTKEGRAEILQHYAVNRPFAEPIDFMTLAAHTYGFSGAQLKSVMNQSSTLAARRAIREGQSSPLITAEDLEEAISRVISGPAMKSRRMNDTERRQVAYHEAGHAVVQYLLPECDDVQKISIVSRNMPGQGAAMGYVQTYSEDDKYIMTAAQCRAQLAALLAGRAAERHFCGIETAGASDDLKRASSLAYRMYDEYAFTPLGMNGDRGTLRVRVVAARKYITSESREDMLDARMEEELGHAYGEASRIVTENTAKIELIVSKLLENETIDADEIKAIMEGGDGDTPRTDGDVPKIQTADAATGGKEDSASIDEKKGEQADIPACSEQTVPIQRAAIPSFLTAGKQKEATEPAIGVASGHSGDVSMETQAIDVTSMETVAMTADQIKAASRERKPSHFAIDESMIRDESTTMTAAATDALATLDSDPSPDDTNLGDNGGAWLRMEELQPEPEPSYEQTLPMPRVRQDAVQDAERKGSRRNGGR